MSDELHEEFVFSEVQIHFISHSKVASLEDHSFHLVMPLSEAIKYLQTIEAERITKQNKITTLAKSRQS